MSAGAAMPEPTLVPGADVGGYLLERVIGRGGMGVVWRARQVALDRPVALKVLAPRLAADRGFRERFEQEARLAARLRHPHIVVVHDAREDRGILVVAMDLVAGVDLAHAIRAEGRLPVGRAVDLTEQVAAALDAAHAQRLVHRDVKPANVLLARVGRQEHAYLTDFGLAKALNEAAADGMSVPGMMIGTPEYMAPEQALEEPVDARADVYALGCVLFELLSGEPPYQRDNSFATLFAHVDARVPSVRTRVPELPPALDDVVERALAKAPDARFQSAGELARAAREAAGGHGQMRPQVAATSPAEDWEGHVVVAGLHAKGSRLALNLNAAGYRVVAIEADQAREEIARCREHGIQVHVGDATDPEVLRRARVTHARHLIVACGDDARNVNIATTAEQEREPEQPTVLVMFVHVDELALQRALMLEELRRTGPREVRLECFNAYATGVRLLLERHPPFENGAPPRIGVVGGGKLATSLIVSMASAWELRRENEVRLPVTVVGPQAEQDVASLLGAHPRLSGVCAIDPEQLALDSSRFQSGEVLLDADGECTFTKVYVALDDGPATLAAAVGLHAHPTTRDIPVVVAVQDEGGEIARALRGGSRSFAQNVQPFGVLSAALTPTVLLRGVNEVLARANHQNYVREQRAAGVTEGASLAPWDDLPESLKNSNRRFGDAIGGALEAVGCALVPAAFSDAQAAPFTADEVEHLAKREHDRWIADLLRDGWRPTAGEKDPERKLHPLLVPWAQLSEAERDKDRDAVRAIPHILAQAGFAVIRS